jgi:hypothetical protein
MLITGKTEWEVNWNSILPSQIFYKFITILKSKIHLKNPINKNVFQVI